MISPLPHLVTATATVAVFILAGRSHPPGDHSSLPVFVRNMASASTRNTPHMRFSTHVWDAV